MASEGKVFDPMHQFEIVSYVDLGPFDFTNSSLWMFISVALVSVIIGLGSSGRALVPTRWQSVAELSYEFVAGMIRSTAGTEGLKYFPIIFTLFMFVLSANMLGMMPASIGSFTTTSHVAVTLTMALVVFFGVTILGFVKHGPGYLKLFVPHGVPMTILPIVVVIEIVSYLSRPITLSVRLFANMLAGHTMLKVLGGFVVLMGVGGILPLTILVGITALEFLIAFLQAYVFTILACIYLNDALHLH
jgi:F-type H+-transporting ATPase subunit a